MSSHKIRIYDLSKELNQDNKDILTICDRLGIAVKNHSSTITAAEADQIRQTALQSGIRDTSPSPAKRSRAADSGKPSKLGKPSKPFNSKSSKKDKPRKPQILELRKRKSKPGPLDEAPEPTQIASPVSETPVLHSPKPPRAQSAPEEQTQPLPLPDLHPAPAPRGDSKTVKPLDKPLDPLVEAVVPAPAKPRLITKPILQGPRSRTETTATPDQGPEPQAPAGPKPSPVAQAPVPPPLVAPKAQRSQTVRPTSPLVKPNERQAEEAITVDAPSEPTAPSSLDPEGVSPEVLKPKRVTSTRSKRGKTEELEEIQEDRSGKPSKASLKQQRRLQKQIEDDEDEVGTQDVIHGAVVDISQSLVRPPKPKSVKQSRPTATPAPRTSPPRSSRRSQRDRDRQQAASELERPTKLVLTNALMVKDLASQLTVPETEVIKILFLKGIAANINQTLDLEMAQMVAEELGVEVETAAQAPAAQKISEMLDVEDLENLQRRPPVVTIMGHVDHGKTTLLDAIRETKVAEGEAGGITQHIGAYHVDIPQDGTVQQVVFLDTPGHEAFTAMRARGTRVTDIAILVVAADDGVRPQTIEAISHARAAKVPIIVAINKVDKEGAQPDRVMQELTEHELVPEDWGGDTIMVPVSALKGENLDTLLEMILLVAEVEDLQANPERPAKGTVIEAHLDKARGPVATLLLQNGTLNIGDVLVVGSVFGKVRAMVDDRRQRVETAGPSFAVEVLGLGDVPAAGDEFMVLADEKAARSVAGNRFEQQRQTRLQQSMASRRVSLSALSDQAREGELKELNLILKADVQGSVEAILGSLAQLPQEEVQVRVLLAAPGEISETDVDLAAASNAVIVGFNTSLASGARQAADQAGVDIREYTIIYKLLEDIEAAMEGLLEPELVEDMLGQSEVRAVFTVGRGAVAGCYVQSGKLVRNCRVRVHRGGEVVHEGILDSLRRMKEDAREVNAGYECGVGLDNFNDWADGDLIEAFQLVTKRRSLSPVSST